MPGANNTGSLLGGVWPRYGPVSFGNSFCCAIMPVAVRKNEMIIKVSFFILLFFYN
jgi:hypothetical protein